MDETRRERWERAVNWPLMVVALGFLVAYAWPILDPDLSPAWVRAAEIWMAVSWAAFAIDYAVRLALSRERGRFVRYNVVDLLVVVVPLLRPLRLLQLVRVLEVLHRSAEHILTPEAPYETAGTVPNVVFPTASLCDAPSGRIALYCGAADTFTTLAFTNAFDLIAWLKTQPKEV